MANEVKIVISADSKDAQAEFKKTQTAFDKLRSGIVKNSRAIGIGMTAIGAAITGVGILAVKSSLDQQVGIARLDQALKNVGTTYEIQKRQIEAVIEAQQRKTNFGDEEQRKALVLLTGVIGDHEKALQILPTVLDAAAFSGKDLNAVLQTMPRFFAGVSNTSIAAGVTVDKLATFEERLAAVQEKVNGAAAAAADPLTQMKNRMGDLLQVLGDALLPLLEKGAVVLEKITRRVIEWTNENPKLAKILAIVGVAIGGILLVLGPLLLMLPTLITSIKILGITSRVAMGATGVGLIVVILSTLATVVLPLLLKNWDTVWSAIKTGTEASVNFIINLFNKMTFVHRQALAGMLVAAKAVLDALPGANKFGEAMQSAIDKIRAGIPDIDITAEKVADLAVVWGETADDVGQFTKGIVSSTGTMKTNVVKSVEEMAKKVVFNSRRAMLAVLGDQATLSDLEARVGEVEERAFNERVRVNEAFWERVRRTNDQVQDLIHKDFVDHTESIARQAQVAADELEKINKRIADDTARAAERVTNSWKDFRLGLNPVIARMREAGISFEDLVKGLAEKFGILPARMADFLEIAQVKFGDFLGLLGAVTEETVSGILDELIKVPAAVAAAVGVRAPSFNAAASGIQSRLTAARSEIATIDASANPNFSRRDALIQVISNLQQQANENQNRRINQNVLFGSGGVLETGGVAGVRTVGGQTVIVNLTVAGDVIGVDDLDSRILQTVRDNSLAGGGI